MENATARWRLPLLHAGQAQKEIDHNEALALLDMAVQPAVTAMGADLPPAEPAEGACWVVGDAPVGAWAGQARSLAGWTAGGWRFLAPHPGMTVWRIEDGLTARYQDAAWRIGELCASSLVIAGSPMLAAQQSPIAGASGGSTIDLEAREVLEAVLETLRNHHLIGR